jgi:hypothetical protein
MTPKQTEQFNLMRRTLVDIAKFDSPERLRRDSVRDYGLTYEEALEVVYANVRAHAAFAVRGVRRQPLAGKGAV